MLTGQAEKWTSVRSWRPAPTLKPYLDTPSNPTLIPEGLTRNLLSGIESRSSTNANYNRVRLVGGVQFVKWV